MAAGGACAVVDDEGGEAASGQGGGPHPGEAASGVSPDERVVVLARVEEPHALGGAGGCACEAGKGSGAPSLVGFGLFALLGLVRRRRG